MKTDIEEIFDQIIIAYMGKGDEQALKVFKKALTQDRANTIEAVREMLEGLIDNKLFDFDRHAEEVVEYERGKFNGGNQALTTALEQLDALQDKK